MTDRDHFAAAALTGLLHHNYEPQKPVSWWVEQAYDYADAMLRERAVRDSRTADKTNHDAAPAARAVSDEDRTDKAATSHRRDRSGEPPCLAKGQVPLGSESVAGTNSCRRPSQTGRFSDRIRQFFCSRT